MMLGFLGDVGVLSEALEHELADCPWSVMSLADTYGVALEATFERTMDSLTKHLADQEDAT